MAFLHIEDLTFSYAQDGQASRPVLEGVSFDVDEGSILLICGASASGKTTLLRLMKPLIAPAGNKGGRVMLDGLDVDRMAARSQAADIGFVMQDPASQICTDNVLSELAFGLENLGVEPCEMRSRVAEVALFFGLHSILQMNASDLSGGQKQILNLASTVVMRPKLLLLDEPMAQLDPIARESFLNMLVKLNSELGITIVIAEHYLDDIASIADEMLFLDSGEVLCQGTPSDCARFIHDSSPKLDVMLPCAARLCLNASPSHAEDVAPFDIPFTVKEARKWLKRSIDRGGNRCPCVVSPTDPRARRDASDPALLVKDVWFRYERNAPDVLKGSSFSIEQCCITALLGGNGSGKTTLLKVMAGCIRPYMGKVECLIEGDASNVHSRKSDLRDVSAYLPQDPTLLFIGDTVMDEIAGHEDILHEWGIDVLDDVLLSSPFDISGGQQQLLGLLKVLASEAQMLFLDEPTKGMDIPLRERALRMIRGQAERGRTIVLATHDLDMAAQCADLASMAI